MRIERLDAQLKAICPCTGVSIGRWDNKTSWRVDFLPGATQAEKDAAQAVIDNFDPNADHSETDDEHYDKNITANPLLKAIVLSINDGTLITGANKTNAQLKAIIRTNM